MRIQSKHVRMVEPDRSTVDVQGCAGPPGKGASVQVAVCTPDPITLQVSWTHISICCRCQVMSVLGASRGACFVALFLSYYLCSGAIQSVVVLLTSHGMPALYALSVVINERPRLQDTGAECCGNWKRHQRWYLQHCTASVSHLRVGAASLLFSACVSLFRRPEPRTFLRKVRNYVYLVLMYLIAARPAPYSDS